MAPKTRRQTKAAAKTKAAPVSAEEQMPSDLSDAPRRKSRRLETVDYFSLIPLDCKLKVLEKVNHDDLDQCSVVSQAMNEASKIARQNCRKVPAKKINLSWSSGSPELDIHLCRPYMGRLEIHHSFENRDERAFVIAQAAIKRYKFERVTFKCWDYVNEYLMLLQQYLSLDTPDYLKLSHSADNNINVPALINWISSCNPKNVHLTPITTWKFHRFELLEKLSAAVENPSINITEYCGDLHKTSHAPCHDDALNIYSQFKNLYLRCFIFDTNHLVQLIVMRQRKHMIGCWELDLSRPISEEKLRADFGPSITITKTENRHYTVHQGGSLIIRLEFKFDVSIREADCPNYFEYRFYGYDARIHFH